MSTRPESTPGGAHEAAAGDASAAVPARASSRIATLLERASLSARFIDRPVATTLLTLGLVLAGLVGLQALSVAPLPQVDFPTISVTASLPGGDPQTIAATMATPLERALGRIAGVTEITSWSPLGNTRVTLQFELSKDINTAAREVQAALNAARAQLPTGLPSNPIYRKVNPAESPIAIVAMTSATMSTGQMYDWASTVLAQKLSQVRGVGQVTIGGGSLPAVRVELNPAALARQQLGTADVRNAIVATNANRPKGVVWDDTRQWQIEANDQARRAADYAPLIVAWRNGAPVRLADVAEVLDSVQDVRNAGTVDGRPAVSLVINRQPGANIIETVDEVRSLLPVLRASVPAAIDLQVVNDRTPTIRASLREVERTLVIAVALVVMVVFVFLRNARAALIPSVAVPASLAGTFGIMYLAGFSLNNLSLMALTVATGFVVDDAVVMLENVSRHIEAGLSPREAALRGAREVGFTVVSMSVSLVAVFIPILLMGGIVGRFFREFALTLSAAVGISLLISLTTTPMMCARLLRARPAASENRWQRASARVVAIGLAGYRRTLDWTLRHSLLVLAVLAATVALNVYLYTAIPKGFIPRQDTGRIFGWINADESISFQAMREKVAAFVAIVRADPAVEQVTAYTGSGSSRNGGSMFVSLKPLGERKETLEQVIARLRLRTAHEPGAMLYLSPVQDIRVGGRQSNALYQFTLRADTFEELSVWEPRVRQALSKLPELADVSTDRQDKGLQARLVVDRDAMSRVGLTMRTIDGTLNDLFGQRIVSTIYNPLNQYRVVLEAQPSFWQSPESLKDVWLSTPAGEQVPLASLARFEYATAPLGVSHQGQFAASTISYNLPDGVSMSQARTAVEEAVRKLALPTTVYAGFEGTARAFQSSLDDQPMLIVVAILAVYIVLGILYESTVHPVTILSTLPSAGVGALIALLAFDTEFSLIAMIGVILLIGIVKKNAIMMVDFAIVAMRDKGLAARDAIREACLLRFRPIMMTTLAALFGALPLALGAGDGAELRRPLGISIVGGLLLSQVLTLYTTPVVFLYLDRLRARLGRHRAKAAP
jgi:multidrug efflux pump